MTRCWLCGFETTELATNAKAPACENGPCHICTAVATIDDEINQAVATLRRLLIKRCDLRSEQNRVHGTLIHRLPSEIKDHIFQLLAPARTEWGALLHQRNKPVGRGRRQIIEPPTVPLLSYTSVCRSWRDLAWSNPFLWSTIHISLGSRARPSDTPRNFVRDWVQRSQIAPATLHIVENIHSEQESLKGVIASISACSSRCHSLSLDILSSEPLQAFHHTNFPCHLLRSLRIHAQTGWQRDTHQPALSNLTMSPENIELRGVPFNSLQISWHHLTSAKVENFNSGDLVQLFQHASQMTSCHIGYAPDNHQQTSPTPIPPIVHHKLKTLSIRFARGAQDFLASLTLPCLHEFHANDELLLNPLPALVRRSSCPLTRITFTLVKTHGYGAPNHLQPLPGVTDLHLVLESLVESSQFGRIRDLLLIEHFPDLRNLTLRLDAFLDLCADGVISLLVGAKGRPRRILVKDHYQLGVPAMMSMASSRMEKLKTLGLGIDLTEDGFEVLIPED